MPTLLLVTIAYLFPHWTDPVIPMDDIKRGDIGSTAQGYSNAYLGKTKIGDTEQPIFDVDFVTVNPYMGTDCIKPFVEDCKKYNMYPQRIIEHQKKCGIEVKRDK